MSAGSARSRRGSPSLSILLRSLRLPVPVGTRADDDEHHGRHDHFRAVLQYAARSDRSAFVRPRRLLRARRLRRDPRDERVIRNKLRDSPCRSFLSSAAWPGSFFGVVFGLGLDAPRRNRFLHDFARDSANLSRRARSSCEPFSAVRKASRPTGRSWRRSSGTSSVRRSRSITSSPSGASFACLRCMR